MKKMLFWGVLFALLCGCSGDSVAHADYFVKEYKFGEIVNSSDFDVQMLLKLSHEKIDDSLYTTIAKGDTFYLADFFR